MKHDVETAAGPTCPPPPYIPRQPLRDRETIEVVQRRWWLDRCLVGRTIWNSNSRIFKKARPEQRDPISGRLLPAPPTDISFTRIKFRTTLERVREIFEDVGGDGWLFQGVDIRREILLLMDRGKGIGWQWIRGRAWINHCLHFKGMEVEILYSCTYVIVNYARKYSENFCAQV